eukprot:TRINITY_DN4421_c0_g1_i4.p1 TRINITY_DN4421_c0_g1~~TRINITY_DN4421_c0_g1_i4.p1  ORF type:complete len:218 (+),score=-14.22 TRINITY_DN4421_c0_g1_i4:477-1130(+)
MRIYLLLLKYQKAYIVYNLIKLNRTLLQRQVSSIQNKVNKIQLPQRLLCLIVSDIICKVATYIIYLLKQLCNVLRNSCPTNCFKSVCTLQISKIHNNIRRSTRNYCPSKFLQFLIIFSKFLSQILSKSSNKSTKMLIQKKSSKEKIFLLRNTDYYQKTTLKNFIQNCFGDNFIKYIKSVIPINLYKSFFKNTYSQTSQKHKISFSNFSKINVYGYLS